MQVPRPPFDDPSVFSKPAYMYREQEAEEHSEVGRSTRAFAAFPPQIIRQALCVVLDYCARSPYFQPLPCASGDIHWNTGAEKVKRYCTNPLNRTPLVGATSRTLHEV